MTTTTDRGLYPKYHITRTDGRPVAEAFVLEFDSDPYARVAYAAYADACADAQPGLARAIWARLAATSDSRGASRLAQRSAPALLEFALDANIAIWTSQGHGDYSGHDITAAAVDSGNARRIWVSIAESDPLTPSDVRDLIEHLRCALTVVEGGPLHVDTFRANATYPLEDGGTGRAVVDETSDNETIADFRSKHLAQGHAVRTETRHWQTLTKIGEWEPAPPTGNTNQPPAQG